MSQNLKIEHYILGKTLGIGAFGKVKLARHEFSGNSVAIKIINKKRMRTSNMNTKIKREINLLRYFKHPNIIRLYEVLETQSDIYVVTEYTPNGELFELIAQKGRLNEDEGRFFFQQVIAGVEYCHSHLVSHRDLKPENILIADNNIVKIADFGLSNLMKDGKFLKTSCGSPNYAAPEVISGKKYCGTEIDTWSCGVILFALLAGHLPFDEEVIPALFKKIREAEYQMPDHFSPEAQDLIRRTLQPDVTKRILFSEIKKHPWLQKNTFPYLKVNESIAKMFINRINEDIFQQLVRMGFNYEGFTEQKVREAILKKQDHSFVIAYSLMLDDYCRQQLDTSIQAREAKNQNDNGAFILQDIKNALREGFSPEKAKKESETNPPQNIDEVWHYGLRYKLPANVIMAGITETLVELDTTYIIKIPGFRIKCYNKMHKSNFGTQRIEIESADEPVERCFFNTSKHDKYSRTELVFIVQIYMIESKREYMVDIQRVRGHTILFLQYCQKFMNVLNRNLIQRHQQQQQQNSPPFFAMGMRLGN